MRLFLICLFLAACEPACEADNIRACSDSCSCLPRGLGCTPTGCRMKNYDRNSHACTCDCPPLK